MSVVESPSLAAAIGCLRQRFERDPTFPCRTLLPCKRKLECYASVCHLDDGLVSQRMRESGGFDAANTDDAPSGYRLPRDGCCSIFDDRVGMDREAAAASGGLHFFIRVDSQSMVIHARSDDTVESLHALIWRIRGIPTFEQRLIYSGKQLRPESTLEDCGIQNDACLQLTGRMRSTDCPGSWMVAGDLISRVCHLRNKIKDPTITPKSVVKDSRGVEALVKAFLEMTPEDSKNHPCRHLNVFIQSGAAAALVALYATVPMGLYDCKTCVEKAIQCFLDADSELLGQGSQAQWAPILLDFCKIILAAVGKEDPLYRSSRKNLGLIFESMCLMDDSHYIAFIRSTAIIQEIFPFINQLAGILTTGLSACLLSVPPSMKLSQLSFTLAEFSNFLIPLQKDIQSRWGSVGPLPIPMHEHSDQSCQVDCFRFLHAIFMELLECIDRCLKKLDDISLAKMTELSESWWTEWSIFLHLLTKLNDLSEIFDGAGDILHSVLMERRVPLNTLVKHSRRSDKLWWLLKHRDVIDFESRKNLVLMMFPEGKDDYGEIHEMLIDRSKILSESFEYIGNANPGALKSGLFMEFKNEEATGPGVLREWFCLLCKEIFSTQNVLFVTCPDDHRRFLPNPASAIDPMHLDYFVFCGRVIALALMHKVQIGIVFDRVFFQQLAGRHVSLDDIRAADPYLYNSCKKILEMDSDLLDSDVLGLTFVREMEELGSRSIMELCPGGKDIAVNSENKHKYVNLMIHHCFVTSISEQVAHFSQGFNDILSNPQSQRLFFQSLELEDFNSMLGGSDGTICTNDWKRHTEYKCYKASDRQIRWFWKVVEAMSTEERRTLLFFWTSVKYLPIDGFGGLASKLCIHKTSDSHDRLPTSHTCFYQMCLPEYPSLPVLRKQLQLVTREHVGCSFGNW